MAATRQPPNAANTRKATENTIESFLANFPLQKTNDYLHQLLKGDPSLVNTWFLDSGHLVMAGEDMVVRTNNDTFYKAGYADNRIGPVKLRIENPTNDRFVSIMVQDHRDFNCASIIDANGVYVLVKREQETPAGAQAIHVTDDFHFIVIRVEVRNEADAPAALTVYKTATIEGKSGGPLLKLDLLSRYSPEVRACAMEMVDHWKSMPVEWFVGHPEERGTRISDLDRTTGVRYAEGGPLPRHSTYASFFTDDSGAILRSDRGAHELTMTAPPVYAFWSVAVYDSERGGYLFPNPMNHYSINNTGAVPNPDALPASKESYT